MGKSRRPWLAWELEFARKAIGVMPLTRAAETLGRSVQSVVGALVYYGHLPPRPRLADHEKRLRKLHALGWSDRRIAKRIGVAERTARRWRNRLGLPRVPVPPETRALAHRKFLRTLAIESLVCCRWDKHRVERELARRRE